MSTSPGHVEERAIAALRPAARNARHHSRKQVRQIAVSIERFGFTNPVLVGDDGEIIAGHGRVEAAKLLGLKSVPTLALSHLSAEERRAYVLADNKLAENAGWDKELLALELGELVNLDFEVELTGFSLAEINFILDEADDSSPTAAAAAAAEDQIVAPAETPVTRHGDLWILGRHRLLCGDARCAKDYTTLLDCDLADIVFTDPPYNVPVQRFVSGVRRANRRKFRLAGGELTAAEFASFLEESLGNIAAYSRDGAIAYVCMDWRHMSEVLTAGGKAFTELKNLVVWNKSNGGTGSFYRSKHELIFVFKAGSGRHINNFGLGEGGRFRTNVWDYPGVNGWNRNRSEHLEMHPTVKPVALVADAIRDCSNRGDIVLDPFAGSGTTLLAAEKCGRKARLIEIDPAYCDTIIRRFEGYTGQKAVLAIDGSTFEEIAEQRSSEEPLA